MVHSYLSDIDPILVADLQRGVPDHLYRAQLIRRHRDWDPRVRERIDEETGRIWTLTDELGQEALFGVWPNRAELDELGSGPARAMHVFRCDRDKFGFAESSRFADFGRYGQSWAMANCESGLDVARHGPAVSAYSTALASHFETQNVHVEIYDRIRPTLERDPDHLIQVNVFREGRADSHWSFTGGALDRVSRRPVLEAAVTYEPRTGTVEAICRGAKDRVGIVGPFCTHMLGTSYREPQRRTREYDLRPFLTPHSFPTHPRHAIESVRVVQLRLVPHSTRSEVVTLDVVKDNPTDIWTMAERRLGSHNPLLGGWDVIKARLAIQFRAESPSSRGRTLYVSISAPHSCDLKSRSNHERIVGEYCLREWGVLRGPNA